MRPWTTYGQDGSRGLRFWSPDAGRKQMSLRPQAEQQVQREETMLQNIRNILIGITEEGEADERSSALPYGLALARQANAHVTVQGPP
jgi:hypothetical protein